MPPDDPRPASLGMYDEPEFAAANDALWEAVAARLDLPRVPARLTRSRPLPALWTDPDLLLAQTCGWPLVTTLAGRVRVVATPRYALPGCEGAMHRAWIVVRAGDSAAGPADLRGRAFAVNGWDSNSGMNLPRALFAPLAGGGRFFGAVRVTGAHRASLAAVQAGVADAAAVDCVTFGLLARHAPGAVAGLRVVAETPPSPALPFITRADAPAAEVAALRAALDHPHPALGLLGVADLPADAYAALRDLADGAAASGYPALA